MPRIYKFPFSYEVQGILPGKRNPISQFAVDYVRLQIPHYRTEDVPLGAIIPGAFWGLPSGELGYDAHMSAEDRDGYLEATELRVTDHGVFRPLLRVDAGAYNHVGAEWFEDHVEENAIDYSINHPRILFPKKLHEAHGKILPVEPPHFRKQISSGYETAFAKANKAVSNRYAVLDDAMWVRCDALPFAVSYGDSDRPLEVVTASQLVNRLSDMRSAQEMELSSLPGIVAGPAFASILPSLRERVYAYVNEVFYKRVGGSPLRTPLSFVHKHAGRECMEKLTALRDVVLDPSSDNASIEHLARNMAEAFSSATGAERMFQRHVEILSGLIVADLKCGAQAYLAKAAEPTRSLGF